MELRNPAQNECKKTVTYLRGDPKAGYDQENAWNTWVDIQNPSTMWNRAIAVPWLGLHVLEGVGGLSMMGVSLVGEVPTAGVSTLGVVAGGVAVVDSIDGIVQDLGAVFTGRWNRSVLSEQIDRLTGDQGTTDNIRLGVSLFGGVHGVRDLASAAWRRRSVASASKLADVAPRSGVGLVDDVVNSASMRRMNIPNRIVQDTVDDYIARNIRLFEESGGTIIRNAGPAPTEVIDGVTYQMLGNMNYRTRTIRLYDGHEIQDVVEELVHFRQAVHDGYWGTPRRLPVDVRDRWEKQADILFGHLGFVPR